MNDKRKIFQECSIKEISQQNSQINQQLTGRGGRGGSGDSDINGYGCKDAVKQIRKQKQDSRGRGRGLRGRVHNNIEGDIIAENQQELECQTQIECNDLDRTASWEKCSNQQENQQARQCLDEQYLNESREQCNIQELNIRESYQSPEGLNEFQSNAKQMSNDVGQQGCINTRVFRGSHSFFKEIIHYVQLENVAPRKIWVTSRFVKPEQQRFGFLQSDVENRIQSLSKEGRELITWQIFRDSFGSSQFTGRQLFCNGYLHIGVLRDDSTQSNTDKNSEAFDNARYYINSSNLWFRGQGEELGSTVKDINDTIIHRLFSKSIDFNTMHRRLITADRSAAVMSTAQLIFFWQITGQIPKNSVFLLQ